MTPANSNRSPKKKSAPSPKPSAPGVIIHRLELTAEGKEQTVTIADRFGMTQIAALSRLIEWFAGQSETVHAAILRDGKRSDITRLVLEPIASRTTSRKA